MTTDLIFFLLGLAAIIKGSDILVDGSCSIARKSGISEFVIGLTIVGFGTSCPELVVSLTGAIQGNSDVSIGNIIGSNIFNSLLILGVTAIILPVPISRSNRLKDIPSTIFVTLIFVLFGLYNKDLSRVEGVIFLILFAAYLFYCFKNDSSSEIEAESEAKKMSLPVSIISVIGGLALLICGGRLFVDSSINIAHKIGVSDKIIAITLLAGGTSFPELATCIVAAIKKKGQLALGNILGSNIFNVLLILGISSTITPLSMAGISPVDMGMMIISSLTLLIAAYRFKKNAIDRTEGIIMVLLWLAYIMWLLIA